MAKGGYQKQRLQAKKEAERRARKRARRNKLFIQWTVGVLVFALIATVSLLAAFGGKKKATATATPSTSPSASPSPSPTPSYLIPGCSLPDSKKPNGKQWAKAPAMTIDKTKTYIVTFKTTCGNMQWQLDAKEAPTTTNSIVFLVKNHFYDNTIFHRVQLVTADQAAAAGSGGPFAIVQGGDPTGTGTGGPGYQYQGEKPPSTAKYVRGTLAMANSGSLATDGSQFFVVVQDWLDLPLQYTIFGKVIGSASFATLDRMIKAQGADLGNGLGVSPNPPIKIISATVTVK